MKFIASDKIDADLEKRGVQWVLEHYGRYRIAPGFSVADYVKLVEFYSSASRSRQDKRIPAPAELAHEPA
ncbi:MAG TPA: hypothetical protein DCQ92_08020 [Verrucomicrobia subdivision 3 bacterium]|nr:hypothetical protein [Limisphaerales bacterium]